MTAIDKLQEFINKVGDQRDIRIDDTDADRLGAAASDIIAEILADLDGEMLDDEFLTLLIA